MLDKKGFLSVRTYTAGGALPIEGAIVRIFGAEEENRNIVYSLISNADGVVEELTLPAPSELISIDPYAKSPPYSVYNLEIYKEGYFSKKIFNVPIFEGIKSVQRVGMIPYSSNIENYPRGNVNADIEN